MPLCMSSVETCGKSRPGARAAREQGLHAMAMEWFRAPVGVTTERVVRGRVVRDDEGWGISDHSNCVTPSVNMVYHDGVAPCVVGCGLELRSGHGVSRSIGSLTTSQLGGSAAASRSTTHNGRHRLPHTGCVFDQVHVDTRRDTRRPPSVTPRWPGALVQARWLIVPAPTLPHQK